MTYYKHMLLDFSEKFNFFGLNVIVRTNCSETLGKIVKDFSYFKSSFNEDEVFLSIEVSKSSPPLEELPKIKPTFKRKYSTTYDVGRVRYNDYSKKALTIFDYGSESAKIFTLDADLLHELTYLIILSRIGKEMDLMGLHRIHAMGFQLDEKNILFMMEMGGGKSTLLSNLLNYSDVKLISDDTPIVDKDGLVHPFPNRLGAYPGILKKIKNREENIYSIRRQEFGQKDLICLDGIENEVAKTIGSKSQTLIQGKRSGGRVNLSKANIFQKYYYLSIHLLIGIGLPMIFEYFWEKGIVDFFVKTKIAILRMRAVFKVLWKSDFYIFEMSEQPEQNAKFLYDYFKEK